MPTEIERKFLVRDDAWRAHARDPKRLLQGYLSREPGRASVRVRLEGNEARLNIKAAVTGSSRAEYEYDIPVDEAREMLARLAVGRVEKVRHHVQLGGHTWEVDEFLGDNAPLVVAEIELDSADEAFTRPEWLGREVTDDQRYYNHHLALHPYVTWPQAARD